MKKQTETPLACIKKKNRWYNTITKKYVSESYAKRLNAYFKKHPERTLAHARGHLGTYDKDISITEQSKRIREMLYGKGTQTIRTKTRKGKTVHYSPMHDEFLMDEQIKKLKKMDYTKNGIKVQLYRFTRDKASMYHVLSKDVFQRLASANMVEFWTPKAWYIFNSMMNETLKICKKHKLAGITLIYCHIGNYFYSDYDGWEKGTSIGFVTPNRSGQKIMKDGFRKVLNWYRDKLEIDAYHNIMVQTITFYIYTSSKNLTELQREIGKYRVGVTHIPYKKDKPTKKEKQYEKLRKMRDI